MNTHLNPVRGARTLLTMAGAALAAGLSAQTAPAAADSSAPLNEDEIIVLSPFEVTTSATTGYAAATTLAGNRLNTELRDIGSAVSVVTTEFLKDIGATDNRTLLQYTTGSEVGGSYGNFAGSGNGASLDESGRLINPNQNTRIRGLTSADNTRDFFLTDIPWDGYAVDGVDLQRGPNSILFGQGSPAGIINTRTKQAMFRNANEVQFRLGSYGANRQSIDVNRVLLADQLAVRLALLRNDDQFKQEPAHSMDKRLYSALRFEPAFLKKAGMRTILKANFEAGKVRSSNPRTLPPMDRITPWFETGTYQGGNDRVFDNLNRQTFVPANAYDDNTGLPNHGQARASVNGGPTGYLPNGTPMPYLNPWILEGNFGQQFGGPLVTFDGNSSTPTLAMFPEPNGSFGLNSAGALDRGIGGIPFARPLGIISKSAQAIAARLPLYQFGVYKDNTLTDSSVFDFYNQLYDGPTKEEWQDFRAYNVSLAQTFFNDQIGFELTYNNEYYKSGRLNLLSDTRQALYIDINKVFLDGTADGLDGKPFADGTPNPNAGRPYITDSLAGGNESVSNKEATRATLFATHDFSKDGKNWFLRLLGKQTVTGLFAVDENERDSRSWVRYTADDAFELATRAPALPGAAPTPVRRIDDGSLRPSVAIYLGPSLLDRTSASGAHIPRPTAEPTIASGQYRYFDSHWNRPTDPAAAGYVNPGDPWAYNYYPDVAPFNNPYGVPGQNPGARNLTQAENPANYVGWTTIPMGILDSEAAPGNRAALTNSATLNKSRVTSSAFVWQGHFWDNAIVGTWGVRKDISKSWNFTRNSNSGSRLPDSAFDSDYYDAQGLARTARGVVSTSKASGYELPTDYVNRLQVTSHSWMVMAHLNDFPGIKQLTAKLPVMFSVYYNKSSNFQPASQRVDMYGDALPPPQGQTTDKGLLIETKDGRFSLKVNKYKTSAVNASTTGGLNNNTWYLGQGQVWGATWANIFEHDLSGNTLDSAVPVPDPTNTRYNYGQAEGETLADAQAREASVVAAWRRWQASVDPRFYEAWKIDLNEPNGNYSYSTPAGLAITEDSVSEGYEFEFNAQPTRNWRLTFNASKTTAMRTNVGGAALIDFATKYEEALGGGRGSAGDLRIWWGGAGNDTFLVDWNNRFGAAYHLLKLQEATNVAELRKWRFNLISNYDFDQGLLKGINAGVGLRYESPVAIGYLPVLGDSPTAIGYDLANPYMGDRELNFDFWVGYRRKIWKDVEWSIQLNVRNAFVGNELIPITTQPDGTPAGYRIKPPQTWQLTNTFSF